MAFLYLLLGHLIGDFVLQTDMIAENKGNYRKWNALHVCIVTACILPLSIPFGKIVILLVPVNGVLHYLLDFYKLKLEKVLRYPSIVHFFIDQGMHILILYLISFFAVTNHSLLLLNPNQVFILLAIVVSTSYAAVQNQLILSLLFPKVKKRFFETGEKAIGNSIRALNIFVFYFSFVISPLFLTALIISFLIIKYQYGKHWFKWSTKSYLAIKVSMDILMPFIGFTILLQA
jgi:hypothetical protein